MGFLCQPILWLWLGRQLASRSPPGAPPCPMPASQKTDDKGKQHRKPAAGLPRWVTARDPRPVDRTARKNRNRTNRNVELPKSRKLNLPADTGFACSRAFPQPRKPICCYPPKKHNMEHLGPKERRRLEIQDVQSQECQSDQHARRETTECVSSSLIRQSIVPTTYKPNCRTNGHKNGEPFRPRRNVYFPSKKLSTP